MGWQESHFWSSLWNSCPLPSLGCTITPGLLEGVPRVTVVCPHKVPLRCPQSLSAWPTMSSNLGIFWKLQNLYRSDFTCLWLYALGTIRSWVTAREELESHLHGGERPCFLLHLEESSSSHHLSLSLSQFQGNPSPFLCPKSLGLFSHLQSSSMTLSSWKVKQI